MTAAEVFHCPTCGAPLNDKGSISPTIQCPYCQSSVVVPESLRSKEQAQEAVEPDAPVMAAPPQAMPPLKPYDQRKLVSITRQMVGLIHAGNKIAAIRLLREKFPLGLKEAKDIADQLEAGSLTEAAQAMMAENEKLLPQATTLPSLRAAKATNGAGGATGCIVIAFVASLLLITVLPILIALAQPGGPLAGAWARINPQAYGRVTLSFGKEGTGQGMFQDPRSIGVDPDGNIYIGEYQGGRVQVFDADGKFRSLWLGEKKRILEALVVDRKGVVSLAYGGEIHRVDGASGEDLGLVVKQEDWYFEDVAVAPDGGLVAVSWGDTIVRFDASGKAILVLPHAISAISGDPELGGRVAVDGLGNIYVLAPFNNGVFKFSPDGRFLTRFSSQGDKPGQLHAPDAIAVDGFGRVFVSDFNGIQVFDGEGRYLNRVQLEKGVAFGMVFNADNELFAVTNAPRVLRFNVRGPE